MAKLGTLTRRLAALALGVGVVAAPFVLAAPAPNSPASHGSGNTVALRAGTIHLVEGGQVLAGGTVLVEKGKVVAVGKNVAVPRGVAVVDYGPDASIVPGYVLADTSYGSATPSPRAADPALAAIDHFDPYTNDHRSLTGGVTSTYIPPARGRLIAGQGAVVKSWGAPGDDRVVSSSTGIHGSISSEARSTPGFWEPPVPATVDVGLGVEQPQLPRTTMGAIVGLDELLNLANGTAGERQAEYEAEWGAQAGPALRELVSRRAAWRMGAETAGEIRALLDWFGRENQPLVLDGTYGMRGGAEMAAAIAAAKVPVILAPDTRGGRDFGKGEDAPWPRKDTAAKLAAQGVRLALTPGRGSARQDLAHAAAAAMGEGLDAAHALRSITLTPAEILGVADRVGSIAPGKDGDLVVLSGAPMEGSVVATWIGGRLAWQAEAKAAGSVILSVEELHLGDGQVLIPGEVLVRDGKIASVGRRVGRPTGVPVVHGVAAGPGLVDAFGYLGLAGSRKSFSSRLDLARIVEPGDYADRQVARGGVTTVHLASRAEPGSKGQPTMAYKPAGSELADQIISKPATLHLKWTESIRSKSGVDMKGLLGKADEYAKKWSDYERAIAAWTPPKAAPPEEDDDEEEDDEDEDEEEEDEDEDEDKKKKKDKDAPAEPITGVWEGELDGSLLRLRVNDSGSADGPSELEGNLRCNALSETLVELAGSRDDRAVVARGLGSRGHIELALELDEEELSGVAKVGGDSHEITLAQTSKEYLVAGRRDGAKPPPEERVKPPKGKPKKPDIDGDLEPLRQAMLGNTVIIVTVTRADEVEACLDAMNARGIKPVLYGVEGIDTVATSIAGRVRGVILTGRIVVPHKDGGLKDINRASVLEAAGVPFGFPSLAEEGAVELSDKAQAIVNRGLSPVTAMRALTYDAARMLRIDDHVGSLQRGRDADILLYDASPLNAGARVVRVWVNGTEVQ